MTGRLPFLYFDRFFLVYTMRQASMLINMKNEKVIFFFSKKEYRIKRLKFIVFKGAAKYPGSSN